MKIKTLALSAVIFGIYSAGASAQITISNFSNFSSLSPNGQFTWISPVLQVTQNTGFITIAPVSGGNPTENGAVDAFLPSALNLSAQPNIALTARFDASNADTTISIGFTDGDFNTATRTFSGFTSTFSEVSFARTSFTGTINWTDITGFTIGGGGVGSNAVRWSVDNLAAVPEPSTYALMALGGLVLFLIARRRKSQQQA